MSKPGSETPHYHGHRERLRARLLAAPLGSLPDYELLELVLCWSHPRRDVKPLAKQLLQHYGSLAKLLSTDHAILSTQEGITETTLASFKLLQDIACRLSRSQAITLPTLNSLDHVIGYCRAIMGHKTTESFRVLFLDNRHHLLADDIVQEGTVSSTAIYPREIIKRALLLDASSMILVHNHPSGDTTPSEEDTMLTDHMRKLAENMQITLIDHLIVSSTEYFSFRERGELV